MTEIKRIETLDDHVFASFNHVEMQPSRQGIPYAVHANLIHRCLPPPSSRVSWMLRFKRVTGKIKELLKILMLICSCNDSNGTDIQLWKQGNWHTVHTNVKNISLTLPCICYMLRFKSVIGNIKECLKEKYKSNPPWSC